MAFKVTPRSMALARKGRAIAFLATAALLLFAAISVPFSMSFKSGIGLIFLLLAAARLFQVLGSNYLVAAQKAEAGAGGEDRVDSILQALPEGWEVHRNYPADYLGDIDFLVISPEGKAFTVEVKSHKGVVCNDHAGLFRRVGYDIKQFEKDLLTVANNQANWAREQLDKTEVTPIIVFTRAEAIQTTARVLDGVFIAKSSELLMLLKKLASARQPGAARV